MPMPSDTEDTKGTEDPRQRLRESLVRFDAALVQAGRGRPASATIIEHVRALGDGARLNQVNLVPAEEACRLLYAPDTLAQELDDATEAVEALCAAVEQLPPAQEAPPAKEGPPASNDGTQSESPAAAEGLFGGPSGRNPQLGERVVGQSSSRLQWPVTIVLAFAVVAATVFIAFPGKRPYDPTVPGHAPSGDDHRDEHYKSVLKNDPNNLEAHEWLAGYYLHLRRPGPAIFHYRRVVALSPKDYRALNNLAWLFLTVSDRSLRNPRHAHKLAQRAAKKSARKEAYILDTLAVAQFQTGQRSQAIATIQEALRFPMQQREKAYYQRRLKKFQTEQPPGEWNEDS